jgi:hypothetical protein
LIPVSLRFGSTPYYPSGGWLLKCQDVETGKTREFSLENMVPLETKHQKDELFVGNFSQQSSDMSDSSN